MPLFQYKAIDASGKFISGSLDAGNINDLEVRLEKMDMDLVTFKQKGSRRRPVSGATRSAAAT